MGGRLVIARLMSLIEDAVETFINAVVGRLIAAWVEDEK